METDAMKTTKQNGKKKKANPVSLTTMVRRFRVDDAIVYGFSTDFTIADVNSNGKYAPQALIHTIGEMAGKSLGEIKGLEFTVTVEKETA
jgi:hypothetical protein